MFRRIYKLEAVSRSHTKGVNSIKKLINKKLGMLLLGIWLIMTGLLQVVHVPVPAIGMILALLSIAAGGLLVLGR